MTLPPMANATAAWCAGCATYASKSSFDLGDNSHSAKGPGRQSQGVPGGFLLRFSESGEGARCLEEGCEGVRWDPRAPPSYQPCLRLEVRDDREVVVALGHAEILANLVRLYLWNDARQSRKLGLHVDHRLVGSALLPSENDDVLDGRRRRNFRGRGTECTPICENLQLPRSRPPRQQAWSAGLGGEWPPYTRGSRHVRSH
jgi:hypothetical protein